LKRNEVEYMCFEGKLRGFGFKTAFLVSKNVFLS